MAQARLIFQSNGDTKLLSRECKAIVFLIFSHLAFPAQAVLSLSTLTLQKTNIWGSPPPSPLLAARRCPQTAG
jgi:hypothetical protein